MRQTTCAQCSSPFLAQRTSAKFCSATCRQQSRRSRGHQAALEPATGAAPAVDSAIIERTRAELEQLGALDTVTGAAAMILAERLASPRDTGSAAAAVSRELDRLMIRVRSGITDHGDPLDSIRRRRDAKRARAAERQPQA